MTKKTVNSLLHVCSFCGADQHSAKAIITAPGDADICDACAILCMGILLDKAKQRGEDMTIKLPLDATQGTDKAGGGF